MAANSSWLIVCASLATVLLALMEGSGANHLVRRDLQRIGRGGESGDPKNASSTMYFQQLFGKADGGASGGSASSGASSHASPSKNILHYHQRASTTSTTTSKPPVMASDKQKQQHPTSIQAVNATVHGGNLTSSETVNYYGYEPSGSTGNGGINKRHVHYPPVPMDVINADDDSQNDDGDYNDDDDPDDSDDYDGDSGEGDRASDSPGASDGGGGDGDGEERDELDDFDPSATFAIPSNIDPNTPGCKTVCNSPTPSSSQTPSSQSSLPSPSSPSSLSSSRPPAQQNTTTTTQHHTTNHHRVNTRASQYPRHA